MIKNFTLLVLVLSFMSAKMFGQCSNVTDAGTITGDETTCYPGFHITISSVTLPSGGSGTLIYRWQYSTDQVNWNTLSNTNSTTYTPGSLSTTAYYRRQVTRSGCSTYLSSNVVLQTVFKPGIAYVGNAPIFCAGSSITLKTTTTGAGYTYQWSNSSGFIPGATQSTYAATLPDNYRISINNTGLPCTGLSENLSVTTDQPLTTTITPNNFGGYCSATPFGLEAQPAPASNYTYQWYEKTTAIPGATSNLFGAGHNGTYVCKITNTCGTYASPNYLLNVGQLDTTPIAKIYPSGPVNVCPGSSITLGITDPNDFSFSNSFQWFKDGVSISFQNFNSITVNQAGTYLCEAFDDCGQGIFSNPVVVTTNAGTASYLVVTSNKTTFCYGVDSIQFIAHTNAQYPLFQWKINGSAIYGATDSIYNDFVYSGTITCSAITPCGNPNSNGVSVSYFTPPSGYVIDQLPGFCAGSSVSLTASNQSAGITYQWRKDAVTIPGATNNNYAASIAGRYDYKLTDSHCTNVSGSQFITQYNSAPTAVSIASSSGATSFCNNNPTYFYVSATNAISYQWKKDGIAINGATNYYYAINVAGNYSCLAINPCGSTPSNVLNITQATVAPTINIAAAGSTLVCTGNTVTLNATGTNITVYRWVLNGSYIAGATNASYASSQTGTYYCYAPSGCGTSFSNSLQVYVSNTKPVNVIQAFGSTNICVNTTRQLFISNGSAGNTYQWKLNGADINGATNNSYFAPSAGGYTLVAGNGCGKDTSNAIVITVSGGSPTVSIATTDPVYYCTGSQVSTLLKATATFSPTYQWRLNNSAISGATNSTYTATAAGTYTCNVSNACSGYLSNTINITVSNTIPTSVTLSANPGNIICSGTPVTFTATPFNGGATPTYLWKLNGNVVGTNSNTYSNSLLAQNDLVVCYMTSSISCAVNNQNSGSMQMTVTTTPVGTITATPGMAICPDSTVTLNAVAGPYTYKWSTGATTQSIKGLSTGTYSVSVSNVNCGSATGNAVITQAPCSAPTGITVGSVQTTSARIVWNVQDCAYNTQIHYRVFGTSTWTQIGINAPANARTLTGLTIGTKYEYQLRTKCSATQNIYSAWSSLQTFTTKGGPTCAIPTGVTASNLKKDRATITWVAVAGAYSYKLRTRLKGTTAWTNRVILAPTVAKVLTGLTINTAYEYQVQTICDVSGTPASNFSAIKSFTTLSARMEEGSSEVSDLLIYPNPTSEQLTVSSEQLEGSELIVSDILGRIYSDEKITTEGNTKTLDVSNLAQGIYFVTLKTEKGSGVKKFVKE